MATYHMVGPIARFYVQHQVQNSPYIPLYTLLRALFRSVNWFGLELVVQEER